MRILYHSSDVCSSIVVVVVLLRIPIPLNSDSFNKNANISPLHSVTDFNVYPLAKSASISFSIFLRLAPSCTVGSALLTIIKELLCQFVIFYLILAALCSWFRSEVKLLLIQHLLY